MSTQRSRRSTATDRTRARVAVAAHALCTAEAGESRAAKWAARDVRDKVIREEYILGVNTHDLVTLFAEAGAPISRQQVVRIHGAVDRPPLFDVEEATERYRNGESLRDLGRAYGCSDRLVRKALIGAGVEIRDRETAKRVHYAREEAK